MTSGMHESWNLQGPARASASRANMRQLHPGLRPLLANSIASASLRSSSSSFIITVFSWLASSTLSSISSSILSAQLFNMAAEKTPLVASDASAPVQPSHVQRYSKRQAVGRLFAIAATATLILYGIPQGMCIVMFN